MIGYFIMQSIDVQWLDIYNAIKWCTMIGYFIMQSNDVQWLDIL